METKFTKGKWSVSGDIDECAFLDVDCGHKSIATCWRYNKGEEEILANAKLIASAPQLLDLLNDLVVASELSSSSPSVACWNELIEKAKEVIGKATK